MLDMCMSVQVRRAGRHHDAGETLLLDVFFHHGLPGGGAHELVVARDGDVREVLARPCSDALAVDGRGDVAATVADVDADAVFHS
jgi:hypothetical protein